MQRRVGQCRWLIVVFLCALAYGAIVLLPNILQRLDAEFPFHGIEVIDGDQEHYYVARVDRVIEGDGSTGSVYYAGQPNVPAMTSLFSERLIAFPGQLLGLSTAHTFLLSKFLLSVLLCVFVSGTGALLSGRRWAGLLAAMMILCCWFLFSSPQSLLQALRGNPLSTEFLRFARLTHPLLSSTMFFAALLTLFAWVRDKRRWQAAVCATLTGLCFYTYPYAWTFLLALLPLLCVGCLLRHDRRAAFGVIAITAFGVLIGVPALLHVRSVALHPEYADLVARLGLVHTRAPILGISQFLGVAIAIGWLRWGKAPLRWMGIPLAIAGIAVFNQQMLTGVTIVPQHYHWYYVHPLTILLLVLAIIDIVDRRLSSMLAPSRMRAARLCAGILSLLLCVFWASRFQLDSYRAGHEAWGQRQSMSGVFGYLNAHAGNESVVYGEGALAELLPVYTPARSYDAGNANICCLTPYARLQDAYFFRLWLSDLSPEGAEREFLGRRREEVSGRLFGIHYREARGGYGAIEDDTLRTIAAAYRRYHALPLREKLGRYPLTHVALPVSAQMSRNAASALAAATVAYEDDAYRLWEL